MPRESVRLEGLEGVVKTLLSLPPEMVSKRGGPVRASLRKAAKVLLEQWKANIRQVILDPNIDGLPSKTTGLLEKSVRITNSKPTGGAKGEAVKIGIKRGVYPVTRSGKKQQASTSQIQRLLEGGDARMRPHPTIRPAFDARKNEAVETFVTDINQRLERLVKTLARRNGVKN